MRVGRPLNEGRPDAHSGDRAHDALTGTAPVEIHPKGHTMQVIAVHDVDDVEHWYNSPARSAFFEARGMKATAFRDPAGNVSTVAVLIEAPDMESLQAALATPEARVAEEHDGVRVETIELFVDA